MSVYSQKALSQAARLLSLQDRDPFSITLGCFDRNYWQWKFVDFSCPVLQQGVFALFSLYNLEGTPYYHNQKVKTWVESGTKYWIKRQHKDGSYDEAYPHEHSLAATAVSSFYVAESLSLIEGELRERTIEALKRAGDWLLKNDETHGFLTNHLASAAACLYHIYLITKEEKYKDRAEYFIEKIKNHQSKEGWFEEYGGADPGYQTLAVFYLARYWQLSQNADVLDMLRKSMDFLIYCIHPDNTLGGEYGSRNTEFYFPAGFEILSNVIPKAGSIAQRMKKSQVFLDTVDLYNFILMFNNYLFADLNEKEGKEDDFFSHEFVKFFDEAGLFFKNTQKYYCIVGISKGGVIKVYDKEKLVWSNAGYALKTSKGVFTSQWQALARRAEIDDNRVTVRGNFYKMPQKVFSPRLFIMFRMFMAVAGLFKFFRYLIKNIIVKVLIKKEKKIDVSFQREILFEDNKIIVRDRIKNLKDVVWLKLADKFVSIHMGSSKYFQASELKVNVLKDLSEDIKEGEVFYEDVRSF